jgi:UDP-3-O-[3-hydroxymyristoyl] glucosamine N-acyltransferase
MATLRELAELVGGSVAGDGALEISRVAAIDDAGPGEITFVANPKYLAKLQGTAAAAAIVPPGVVAGDLPLIVCRNPYLAFAKILTHLQMTRPEPQGIMAGAWVDPSARLESEVTVYPGCVIGPGVTIGRGTLLYPGVVLYAGVSIGEECLIHAGVVVREGCRIGNRVILQPQAVIGSDGFGFAPDGSRYFKIPQVGIVEIEDDVEIGACCCIDRAALGVTRLRRGVKLDNLIQIAHNVTVGEDTVMAAQVGVAGSSVIGNHCTFGGQAAVVGHIQVGDNLMVGGQSAIASSAEGNQVLSGTPAIPHKDWLKASLSFAKLPEMRKELNRLQHQLDGLEKLIKERSEP